MTLDVKKNFEHHALNSVTNWLYLSGSLDVDEEIASAQIANYRQVGITDVLDCRAVWSDRVALAEQAPELTYWQVGSHDDGSPRLDEWFDGGLAVLASCLAKTDGKLLVHCHLGVNRGPSMAFRLMLELGIGTAEAIYLIKRARPIAGLGYAHDAVAHYLKRHPTPQWRSLLLDMDRAVKTHDFGAVDFENEEGSLSLTEAKS